MKTGRPTAIKHVTTLEKLMGSWPKSYVTAERKLPETQALKQTFFCTHSRHCGSPAPGGGFVTAGQSVPDVTAAMKTAQGWGSSHFQERNMGHKEHPRELPAGAKG